MIFDIFLVFNKVVWRNKIHIFAEECKVLSLKAKKLLLFFDYFRLTFTCHDFFLRNFTHFNLRHWKIYYWKWNFFWEKTIIWLEIQFVHRSQWNRQCRFILLLAEFSRPQIIFSIFSSATPWIQRQLDQKTATRLDSLARYLHSVIFTVSIQPKAVSAEMF